MSYTRQLSSSGLSFGDEASKWLPGSKKRTCSAELYHAPSNNDAATLHKDLLEENLMRQSYKSVLADETDEEDNTQDYPQSGMKIFINKKDDLPKPVRMDLAKLKIGHSCHLKSQLFKTRPKLKVTPVKVDYLEEEVNPSDVVRNRSAEKSRRKDVSTDSAKLNHLNELVVTANQMNYEDDHIPNHLSAGDNQVYTVSTKEQNYYELAKKKHPPSTNQADISTQPLMVKTVKTIEFLDSAAINETSSVIPVKIQPKQRPSSATLPPRPLSGVQNGFPGRTRRPTSAVITNKNKALLEREQVTKQAWKYCQQAIRKVDRPPSGKSRTVTRKQYSVETKKAKPKQASSSQKQPGEEVVVSNIQKLNHENANNPNEPSAEDGPSKVESLEKGKAENCLDLRRSCWEKSSHDQQGNKGEDKFSENQKELPPMEASKVSMTGVDRKKSSNSMLSQMDMWSCSSDSEDIDDMIERIGGVMLRTANDEASQQDSYQNTATDKHDLDWNNEEKSACANLEAGNFDVHTSQYLRRSGLTLDPVKQYSSHITGGTPVEEQITSKELLHDYNKGESLTKDGLGQKNRESPTRDSLMQTNHKPAVQACNNHVGVSQSIWGNSEFNLKAHHVEKTAGKVNSTKAAHESSLNRLLPTKETHAAGQLHHFQKDYLGVSRLKINEKTATATPDKLSSKEKTVTENVARKSSSRGEKLEVKSAMAVFQTPGISGQKLGTISETRVKEPISYPVEPVTMAAPTILLKKKPEKKDFSAVEKLAVEDKNYYNPVPKALQEGKKPAYMNEPISITTRGTEMMFETPEGQQCSEVHNRLVEKGLGIPVETLMRGLLPPTQYNWTGPSYTSNCKPQHPPNSSSGLLHHPSTWLPEEARKVQLAKVNADKVHAIVYREKMLERKMSAKSDATSQMSSASSTRSKHTKRKTKK